MPDLKEVHGSTSPHNSENKRFGRAFAIFVVVAFGLAWLIALPLWLGNGLETAGFPLYALAMMVTPTLGTLAAIYVVERPTRKLDALGITPLRPIRRLGGMSALAVALVFLLCLVALPVGALCGVYDADFTGFSGFRQLVNEQLTTVGVSPSFLSTGTLITLQFVNILIASLFINVLPALGEEIGWRGWLVPRLLERFGPWKTILFSGILWGLWHAPLILLGYNYPDAPPWLGLLAMIGMCTVIGGIFSWLRLRGGSVWPAAFAHSTLNASAGVFIIFVAADFPVNTLHASILGWSGWIIPVILLVVIVSTGQFRAVRETPRPPRDPWHTVVVSEIPQPTEDREINDEAHNPRH